MSTHHEEGQKAHVPEPHVVEVKALYTTTARSKTFNAQIERTVQDVVDQAYQRLEEPRRAGDAVAAYVGDTTIDLAPYLGSTLAQIAAQNIAVQPDPKQRNHLTLELAIEAEPGGA